MKTLLEPTATQAEKASLNSFGFIFLILLLSADVAFILIHCSYTLYRFFLHIPTVDNKYLLLDFDKGYAEAFQYIKEFWIAGLLAFIGFRTRKFFFFAWSLLFLYFLLDDSLSIHEKLGNTLSGYLAFATQFKLEANDLGELIASAFFGFVLLSIIGLSTYLSSRKIKLISLDLAILLGVLIFFGVGMDVLHAIARSIPGSGILTLVEDGGEMMAMSLICWYAASLLESVLKKDADFVSPLNWLYLRFERHNFIRSK